MTFSYEDYEVGSAVQLGAHTFTREEIVEFAQNVTIRSRSMYPRKAAKRRTSADWSRAAGTPVPR